MSQANYSHIKVAYHGNRLDLTLNQPKVRNAMSLAMVREITAVFHNLQGDKDTHMVVLRGAEGFFSAGADLKDMSAARAKVGQTQQDPFFELNRAFGTMITAVDRAPQTTIAVLEGAALGGGFGLACVADIGICHQDCQLGLPETGLGVIPAQIAPFVVKRIGLTHARHLALTGQRFRGPEAVRLGIAHLLAADTAALEEALAKTIKEVGRCAPLANRATKALLHAVGEQELDQLLDGAARDFSAAVQGAEAREGMQAFLEKRPPAWSLS